MEFFFQMASTAMKLLGFVVKLGGMQMLGRLVQVLDSSFDVLAMCGVFSITMSFLSGLDPTFLFSMTLACLVKLTVLPACLSFSL
jgi:uncharacterized membrane protein YdfJ with MMPL/SSD domain